MSLLTTFRARTQPETEEHLRFWLRRVAVHRATDALRSRNRQPEANAEEWMEDAHAPAAEPGASGLEDRMQDLLQTLPETQRVASGAALFRRHVAR